MHYKAPDNSLHFLDDDSYAHVLPAGSVAITDDEAEAEALRPVPPEPTYQQLRAAAYPPHTDYLDAIVKGESTQPYIDACLAVKAKYPKS